MTYDDHEVVEQELLFAVLQGWDETGHSRRDRPDEHDGQLLGVAVTTPFADLRFVTADHG